MGINNIKSLLTSAELRRQAEEQLKTISPGEGFPRSEDEVKRLLHELQVHQIELEMQNAELRRTQGELEAARARYFDLYDLAPVGYCTLNEKGLILEANLTAATLLGVARRALVKRILTRFILKEDQTIYYRIRKLLLETEAPQACELRMVKKDGTLFWAHLEAITALDADGKAISRIGLSDVPERRRVEEALKESEEKYRFLAASVDSMYLMDKDLTYLFMNEGHRTRFGLPLEKIIGRRYGDFHSAEDTRKISDCIGDVCKTGKPIINEHRSERDGAYFLRTFTPLMSQSPAGEISKVVIVSKDITQRKQAEKYLVETVQQLQETRDMLIQFEKEAAVGRLAVSIAHETLNPASIISSRLQFLEEENLSEQARENVRISREQLQRIVKINQDLHQSAAKQPGMLVGGDLRRVIEVGLQMTERRIKEDHVQVEYDPLPEIIPVKMERDRLVKVMVNLILNACDAMTGNQIKRLIITVHHPEDSPKRYSILLTVADNGQGIPTGNLNRIFEPFFTTKDPGKGTGLGLSVSKGIIQEHGGTIHSENNDMGGTSFIVELPLDHP